MNLVLLFAEFLILTTAVGHGQYASILAEQLNQYCENRGCPGTSNPQIAAKIGKAGPRGVAGPRGPPGEVNDTAVNQMITRRLEEFKKEMLKKFLKKDCSGVNSYFAKTWNKTGGVFDIYPDNFVESVEAYCDVTTDGGGWIVFQRRVDGSEDFFRNWADYVNGFGDINKNFWLGLENIHRLTSEGNHELRVDMMDWEGNKFYAQYSTFSIGDAASRYRLSAEGYSGTARDSLTYHNGQRFYTKDSDIHGCANRYKGAWWYKRCCYSNLNGLYKQTGKYTGSTGISWYHLKNTHSYSLNWVEMKFRPSI